MPKMTRSKSRSPAPRRRRRSNSSSSLDSAKRNSNRNFSDEKRQRSRDDESFKRQRSTSRTRSTQASKMRSSPTTDTRPSMSSRLGPKTNDGRHDGSFETSRLGERRSESTRNRYTDKRAQSTERTSQSYERRRNASRSEERQRYDASSLKFENLRIEKSFRNSGSRQQKETENAPDFRGPELGHVSRKEFKKIQIEIRRNIPERRSNRSPIRRIVDPEKVTVPRREGEGRRGIFEREEFQSRGKSRSRSPIPRFRDDDRDLRDRVDFDRKESREGRRLDENYSIKSRLSNRNDIRDDFRDESRNDFRNNFRNDLRDSFHRGRFRQNHRGRNFEARGRGGFRGRGRGHFPARNFTYDDQEQERPQVKPWEVNPEFVPKGRYYFEHDNRDAEADALARPSGRGFSSRGFNQRASQRRPFRRNFNGGSDRSPEWTHDKFSEADDAQSAMAQD